MARHAGTLAALLVLLGLALGLATAPATAQDAPAAGADAGLEQDVQARLAALDDLADLRVSVADGVARLEGEALTSLARTEAEAAARAVPGIRGVDNRIESAWNVPARLEPVIGRLRDRLIDLLALLPLLVVALIVLAIAWMIARGAASRRWLYARIRNPFLRDLTQHLVRAAVFALGLLLALEIVGATAMVGAVLGAAGVASLVAGLAFRDLAENYLATVLLSLRQPFEPDDHVVIDGREGRVLRLTSRATILMTLDGNHLHIPNSTVFKGVILNYSRNPLRRFDFVVPVPRAAELRSVQERAEAALQRTPGVAREPGPSVEVSALLPDRIELRCYGWVDQREHDVAKVRSEAQRLVLAAPAGDGRKRATPAPAADTSPDHQLDAQIEADRRQGAGDLLDARAQRE